MPCPGKVFSVHIPAPTILASFEQGSLRKSFEQESLRKRGGEGKKGGGENLKHISFLNSPSLLDLYPFTGLLVLYGVSLRCQRHSGSKPSHHFHDGSSLDCSLLHFSTATLGWHREALHLPDWQRSLGANGVLPGLIKLLHLAHFLKPTNTTREFPDYSPTSFLGLPAGLPAFSGSSQKVQTHLFRAHGSWGRLVDQNVAGVLLGSSLQRKDHFGGDHVQRGVPNRPANGVHVSRCRQRSRR